LAPAQPAAELEFSPNTAGSAAPASQGAAPVPRKSTEPRLDSFAERSPAPVVVCDHRELASAVARELVRLEVTVRPETLSVADYVVSDRVAIERKTTEDFENSLRDGRLFTQLKALRDAYLVPVLLVEGGLAAAHLSVESIYGAVASVVADLRISIFFTKDAAETARILSALARREQVQERRPVSIRHGKGTMTDDDRLRFLVEGLPDISAVLARRLLAEFGTVQAIANATEEELRRVEGIGRQRAQSIAAILRRRFGDAGDEGTPATDEPLPHAAEPASPEGAL
jgi:Fanconi anemia group M protein